METEPAHLPLRDIYTVSRINREMKAHLEMGFPLLWIEGEISNLTQPRSGHLYFSLKDEKAQVRCAMFRNRVFNLGFRPQDGQQVLLRARPSLYEGRGDLQLVAEHIEEAGEGALRRAFESLKQRLDREGLFASEHKRLLPTLPRRIGVVTSPNGAAIHDILRVLGNRFPAIEVVIYPAAVQGEGAAYDIAEAIRCADARAECDALIVGRGGGSLEDLWAFNEEGVARAIHDCHLPVVSAVGHEVDVTIADLVADSRAPTPSAAAGILSPDRNEWIARLEQCRGQLQRTITLKLQHQMEQLRWLHRQTPHPGHHLARMRQRLDGARDHLQRTCHSTLSRRSERLTALSTRLATLSPHQRLAHLESRRILFHHRMTTALQQGLLQRGQYLAGLGRGLDMVSPLATLSRGYSIALDAQGQAVRDSHQVEIGDRLKLLIAHGHLICNIEDIHHEIEKAH